MKCPTKHKGMVMIKYHETVRTFWCRDCGAKGKDNWGGIRWIFPKLVKEYKQEGRVKK